MPQKDRDLKKLARKHQAEFNMPYTAARRVVERGIQLESLCHAMESKNQLIAPFPDGKVSGHTIPLGVDSHGTTVEWDFENHGHLLLTSAPGMGKFNFIVHALSRLDPSHDFWTYVIQYNEDDLNPLVRDVTFELERRKTEGFDSYLIVLVDDMLGKYASLRSPDLDYISALESLMDEGLNYGIRFCFLTDGIAFFSDNAHNTGGIESRCTARLSYGKRRGLDSYLEVGVRYLRNIPAGIYNRGIYAVTRDKQWNASKSGGEEVMRQDVTLHRGSGISWDVKLHRGSDIPWYMTLRSEAGVPSDNS